MRLVSRVPKHVVYRNELAVHRPLVPFSFVLSLTPDHRDRALFPQILALFAGKGEGEDGVGFVPFSSSAEDESDLQTCGVVLDSTSFYAEGGGQVRGFVALFHAAHVS